MHTVPGLFEELSRLYAEGERAIAEERYQDAIALFTAGLGKDDHFRQRYVTMYAQRAMAEEYAGRPEAALADFTRAIEMEPPFLHAHYRVRSAACLYALERLEEARAAASRLVEELRAARERQPDAYADYLLACAAAIAGEEELFYAVAQRLVETDASYRAALVADPALAQLSSAPRFRALIEQGS